MENDFETKRWWCKTCWQEGTCETNLDVSNANPAALRSHSLLWKRTTQGRCDNPELYPAREVTPRKRVARLASPKLDLEGKPIRIK